MKADPSASSACRCSPVACLGQPFTRGTSCLLVTCCLLNCDSPNQIHVTDCQEVNSRLSSGLVQKLIMRRSLIRLGASSRPLVSCLRYLRMLASHPLSSDSVDKASVYVYIKMCIWAQMPWSRIDTRSPIRNVNLYPISRRPASRAPSELVPAQENMRNIVSNLITVVGNR